MAGFRSGTIVHWKLKGGGRAHGVVQHLIRSRYRVLALTGAGKHNGITWAINPEHLTRVPKGRVPDEVLKAQAALALTGKVGTHAAQDR